MSEREGPIKPLGSGVVGQIFQHSLSCMYKVRNIVGALPGLGQLGNGLLRSPQGLRSDKTLEVKRLFAREHVIHGAGQLVGQDGERFGFAVFAFEFEEILFPRSVLA
jgi:hypothetical protein